MTAPGTSGLTAGTYALLANGGTDSLTGIPELSLTASGMDVLFNNTGVNPSSLPGSTTGNAFSNGNNIEAVSTTAASGSVTLDISTSTVQNVVALTGSFEFADFTPTGGTPEILVTANITSATFGTSTTNLSITGASLVLLVVPGNTTTPTAFALSASGGTDTLNGFPSAGVTFGVSDLSVEANSGVTAAMISNAASATGAPASLSSLPTANLVEIVGMLSLKISSFVSLSGSFSLTVTPDTNLNNTTDFLIGASDVTAFLGYTDSDNNQYGVQVTGAQLGLVIFSTTWAIPPQTLMR